MLVLGRLKGYLDLQNFNWVLEIFGALKFFRLHSSWTLHSPWTSIFILVLVAFSLFFYYFYWEYEVSLIFSCIFI